MRKDTYFDSCGAGKIHVCRWEPKSKPSGVVQILHGIADYAERYDDFANYLTDMGLLVVAEDHMGHGRSVVEGGIRGYFAGGWFCAVNDSYYLYKVTQEEFSDVPYFLFGHSMGSFMAETLLQRYPESNIAGCILCGSGWQPEKALVAGIRLCNAACRIYAETVPSPRLLKLVFGAFNLRVERQRTAYDWVCRNPRVVDELIADPLCSHEITTGLMRDMLTGISFIQNRENIDRMKKELPIFLISGGDDPVGTYGEGVRRIAENFALAGLRNVTTTIYPLCRHEVLNEINHAEVYADIAKWIFHVMNDL